MSEAKPPPCKLYLITPAKIDPNAFAEDLKAAIDAAPDAVGTRSELNRKRARNLTGTLPWITRNSVGTNTHSRLELARNTVGARSSRGTRPIRPRSELAQNIARKRGRNPNRGTEHARN